MKRLAKLELPAFVGLFVAISYIYLKFAPESPLLHLGSPQYFAAFGAVITGVFFFVIRFFMPRNLKLEKLVLAIFLASMPLIYLWSALEAHDSSGIILELIGVVVYGGLAIYGYFRSVAVLGLGIAAHGIVWDLLHHKHSAYVDNWYSFGCFVVDIAYGFLVLTQLQAHATSQNSSQAYRKELS
jgi:hypothetical protein